MQLISIMATSLEVVHLVAFPAGQAASLPSSGVTDDPTRNPRQDDGASPIDDLSMAIGSRTANEIVEYTARPLSSAASQAIHGVPALLSSAISFILVIGAVMAMYLLYRLFATALIERLLK